MAGAGRINVSASAAVGLCATCKHVRVMQSDRGSVFLLCTRSATDQRFAKYPRLPVLSCAGYEEDTKCAAPAKGNG